MPKPPGREPMLSLAETSSGCFRIVTATDTVYEVDLDQRSLLRRPARGFEMPGLMLQDEAPVTLLHVLACAVGAQGRFIVDLHQFSVRVTTWTTAPVLAISQIDQHSGGGETT